MDDSRASHGSLVPRTELAGQLDRCLSSRLTLVVAPAGYGKTTLLGQWLYALPASIPRISITLEEADNEPAHLLAGLLAQVQAALPTPLPPVDETQGTLAYPLAQVFHKAAEAAGRDWLLLLDDYHLITNPAIHQSIDALLALASWPVHLVISGRTQPPLASIARLRVEDRLVLLDERVLRFTRADADTLFKSSGLALDEGDLSLVLDRTEGWAAALRLVCQTAAQRPAGDLAPLLDQAASTQPLFDYLAGQVMARQPDEIRGFLRRTALLPYLSAGLCNAYLDIDSAASVLDHLERSHLFVQRQPVGREARFRYHALFGEFLCRYLEQQEGAEAVKAWHARAAACLLDRQARAAPDERAGEVAAAVDHALAAGDLVTAASAIEMAVALLDWGQLTTMEAWFERLPAEILSARPRLGLAIGLLRERQCRWSEALAALSAAEASFHTESERPDLARAINRQAWVHYRLGDYLRSQKLCDRSLSILSAGFPAGEPGSAAREVAEIHLLQAYIRFETGQFASAIQEDQKALQLFRSAGSRVDEARALSHLAYVYGNQGQLAAYIESEGLALSIFEDLGSLRAASSLTGLSDAYRQLGEYPRSREMAERALQLADAYQDPLQRGYALFLLGHWHREQGSREAAYACYSEARQIGESLREPTLLAEPRRGLALLALGEGNLREARRQAQSALSHAQAVGHRSLEAQALIALGLIAGGSGEMTPAEAFFRQALALGQELGDALIQATVHLYLADLYRGDGREGEALASFAEALAISQEYGYDGIFTIRERNRALPLLIDTATAETSRFSGESLRLLAAAGPEAVGPLLAWLEGCSPSAAVPVPLVRLLGEIGDERAVPALDRLRRNPRVGDAVGKALERISARPGPLLRVSALGGFQVLRGGQPIPESAWQQRRKTRLLLLYLLANSARRVPRDELLEALWPDLPPESAGLALNTTFSDLRKLLEPYLGKGMPSHYLTRDGECYWLVPGAPIWYDAEAFKQGASSAPALDLYRGDFLPEEPYLDWVVRERERLHSQYLNRLIGLLERQVQQGAWHAGVEAARRILEREPWLEEVWRALMTCLAMLGRRSEAIQVYLSGERSLRDELGVEPSAETRALYEQLTS